MKSENIFDPFAGGELLRVSPTTAPQQEIIAAAKMSEEANTAFNEAISLRVDGKLDINLLESCFNTIISRHDILRATFSPAGDDLCLHEAKHLTIDYEDLRKLDEKTRKDLLDSLFKNIAISPMNLEEGPLFFVWVKHLEDTSYEIIIASHHVICDGWSFGVLVKELVDLYRNGGDAGVLPEAPSFFDHAEQLAASAIKNTDNDYWIARFEQLPPTLDFPLDRPRTATRSFSAARLDYKLDTKLVADMPKAASALKSSIVNFVMAGYFSLLYRLTGNQDIVVGLPVAGQAVFNKLNMFGHMVQLIPVRVKLDGDTTFRELVQQVKQEVLNASEHPNFTFGQLIENFNIDRSRVPLISTIFNIDQPNSTLDFGAASATVRSVPRAAESFEIFLNIVPSPKELLIEATYSSVLFSEKTIRSWLDALESILITATKSPDLRLDDLELCQALPEIVQKINQTHRNVQCADFISAFKQQVERSPDATAVISNDIALSYRELDQISSQQAMHLSTVGVGEGSVVGICCQRSEKLLTSIVAMLKLGAAYLPLDPDFPPDRLVFMLEDSAAVAVIEDNSTPEGVRHANLAHIDINDFGGTETDSAALPQFSPKGDRLSYIIYTSGTTGKPKGVKVQSSAMINFLEGMAETPGFSEKDRLLAFTTLSFDISVLELFLPIITGGVTVIASSEDYKDGERLATLIEQHAINVMQATPGTWRMLLASRWADNGHNSLPNLKAISGGEPLQQSLIDALLPHVSELWNGYGPTEATVYATFKRINYTDPVITIGTPVANTQIYILDANLKPQPVSVPGELCIGGKGVTLGYHNRPELNVEKFVEHPDFGRIYRTGDVAKVLPDGDIQHLGRMDDQVKVRGYRIELGEIETAVLSCKEVKQAAVYLWELSEVDVRIVACCIPYTVNTLDNISLRKQLRAVLPNYMVPQYFLSVDTIPLSPNGKVDRRALPRPQVPESTILGKGKLHTDTEKLIARIWGELLNLEDPIGREDNFFEIGGHSLLALEVIWRVEKATGVRLTPSQIITERLSLLAERVDNALLTADTEKDGPVALQQTASRRLSPELALLLKNQLRSPENASYNLRFSWMIEGELNLNSLKNSVLRVFERQTALRTIISEGEDGYYLTLRHVSEIDVFEIVDFSDKAEPFEQSLKDAESMVNQPFEMIDHLLCRVRLYKIGVNKHLLVLNPHQIIFDGWSVGIFLSELEAFYIAALEGRAARLEPLSFQFRDYAEWYSKRQQEEATSTFHRRVLKLPYHKNLLFNIDKTKGGCSRQRIMLNLEDLKKVEAFCAKHGFRLHEVLLSVLAKIYGKLINRREYCIGLSVSGRYSPDVINLIGSYVSILPAELIVSDGDFVSFVEDISGQLKEFYDHQDFSFAELVKGTPLENLRYPIIMPISFAYQDIRNRPRQLANLKLTQYSIERQQTELPIEFWTRVETNGLLLVFDYDNEQVDSQTIASMMQNIVETIQSIDKVDQERTRGAAEKNETKKKLWRRLF